MTVCSCVPRSDRHRLRVREVRADHAGHGCGGAGGAGSEYRPGCGGVVQGESTCTCRGGGGGGELWSRPGGVGEGGVIQGESVCACGGESSRGSQCVHGWGGVSHPGRVKVCCGGGVRGGFMLPI